MSETKKYLVSEYMRSPVITIRPESTFREAIERMLREKTNGLVVMDEQQKLVGILSSWDIIAYIVPDYLEKDKHLAAFEDGGVFAKRIHELADEPVRVFMTDAVHSVKPHSTIMEAATTLSEHNIRQLPVTDENDHVIGYLNRTDIKKIIGDVLGMNT